MDKNTRAAALVAAMALIAAVLFVVVKRQLVPAPVPPGPLVKDALSITRVRVQGEDTDRAFVHVPYARSEDREAFRFVNVAADLNGDGAIAAYDIDGGRQDEWLVRDMASFATGDAAVGYPVSVPDRAFQDKLPIAATVVFTAAPLEGGTWPGAFADDATVQMVSIGEYAVADRDMYYVTDGEGKLDTGRSAARPIGRLAVATPAPGATGPATPMPGEPQDYSHRREDIPDRDQRYNECSPTGISNNFTWLARQHGFEDRMPDTSEALINELKGDLLWDNGVTPGQNTIDGKRAFIQRRGLPLEAHLIGEEFDNNIQYKIFQELEKGQAVEVGMVFIGSDGSWNGAHLVGVAGVQKVLGARFIMLVDPGWPARSNGPSYEVYGMNGNEVQQYDQDDTTRIRFAYAQSPILDAEGNLVFPGPTGSMLQPGETLQEPDQANYTMARGNFGFFNVTMDAIGDHMVGDTFTARATVVHTGRRTTIRYVREGVTHRFTFGAKMPYSLRGHFIGGSRLSPNAVERKPDTTSVNRRQYEVTAQFTCREPGLAKVKYVAFLDWDRDGAERPTGVWETYAAQIDATDQMVTVESGPFRCLTPYVQPPPPQPPVTDPWESEPRAATCPGLTEDPKGQRIDVLVLDGKCYPASQFHLAEPDRCRSRHWHWNGSPVVSFDGTKRDDPAQSGCGFGTETEVEVRGVTIGQEDAAKFLGDVFGR